MIRRRSRIELKTPDQMRQMRQAGLVVSRALTMMGEAAQPGVSTSELDAIAKDVLASAGAASSFLHYGAQWGYPPYPAVSCISVNEVVVHGIPGGRRLAAGDIVSIDFGAIVDGWHADAARTFTVGDVDAHSLDLIEATRQSMWAGIAQARPGRRIGDVSAAIEENIRISAQRRPDGLAYGIVRDYTGHGIGSAMHQPPDIPNFGRPGTGPRITAGMCLAIEPMLTLGTEDTVELADEWTVVTADQSRAAHWENTVVVTQEGLWVTTEPDGGAAELTKRDVPFAPLGE